MRKIPLTKPSFDNSELENLKRCLDSGWVTQGPMVDEFEKGFAEKYKIEYAYAVNSCTSALHLAALALGLGPEDEVLVPAFTWVTSANCIEYTGAKAMFVDIDLRTFNIDPHALEAAINPRTKAIVVVHLFGLSAEMDKIMEIAARHNLKIIEDAACAIGTTYDGAPVGGIGDLGCFSFHPRKVITTGEGGMVTTNSKAFAESLKSLRNHGASSKKQQALPRPYMMGEVDRLGYNFRMSDIQGAVGLAQLDKLQGLLEERYKWGMRYNEELSSWDDIAIPYVPEKSAHTYQSYVIRLLSGDLQKRNSIMDSLADAGIWTRPGTHAVHRLEIYRNKYEIKAEDFPNSSLAEDSTITLPIFPGMTDSDFDYIIKELKNAFND